MLLVLYLDCSIFSNTLKVSILIQKMFKDKIMHTLY